MIGASAPSHPAHRSLVARPTVLLLAVGIAVLVLLTAALVAIAAIVSVTMPHATIGLSDGAKDLPLGSEFRVGLTGWNAHLENATLYEAPIAPDGRTGPERPRPVQASMIRESRWSDGSELSLRPADGPLKADAGYRLVVQGSALTAALPSPARSTFEREVRFTTLRSPVPRPAAGPAQLKWQQPLQIQWSAPIDDVRYEVSPPTPIRTAIDPANRQIASVVLENPDDQQTYQIAVVDARGANGIPLAQRAEYTVVAPPRPKLLDADEPTTVEIGKPLTLRWSVPIDRLELAIDPPATVNPQVDRRDPTVVTVALDGLAQGTSYDLKVTQAVSKDGAPLTEQPTFTFKTPERLMVEALEPDPEAGRVSVKAKPILTFTQPIRDRKAATAAISLSPAVPGRWEWLDDQRIQFTPTRELPYDAEIAVKVRPGPDGARSAVGSYFEREAVLPFVTEADKLIDIDVTKQIMTIYEKGQQVRTFKVATGVPGADTPIGEFNVEYKMPTARFVGTNVGGSRYNIPDVRWVLAFMGDYTIHGAYWRTAFGTPGSNGCVSLTDADAKTLFDWAPEGTRIKIHY
jgi:lipoprotein-anchoring transpeptidase ErfK/SrfK